MRNWFFCLLMLSSCLTVIAGDPSEVGQKKELSILTYNVKFLPRILLNHAQQPVKRARLIPQQIISDTVDVVVLQEAFDRKAIRIVKRALAKEFPFYAGPANRKVSFKLTSGVMMFSRLPIKQLDEVDFTTCDGSDCWARKGGLLCEVTMADRKVQIMGTHAEAGGSFEMKVSQFFQLQGLMNKHYTQGVPQIACGDFNCSISNKLLYDSLVNILGVENGPLSGELQYTSDHLLNDLDKPDPKRRNLIDHIFYRSGEVKPVFTERKVVRYQKQWHKSHKDLSDHFAVKMKLIF